MIWVAEGLLEQFACLQGLKTAFQMEEPGPCDKPAGQARWACPLWTWVGLGVLNSLLGPTCPSISCASLLAQDWCPTR